jgi:O-antigen/teichoic acid export membrane protein
LQVVPAWVPFGTLVIGNLASLAAAALLATARPVPALGRWDIRMVMRSGRWLVVLGLIAPVTAYLANLLVTHLAGPATLGLFETTRVAAQPLFFLMTGLSAVLGPRLLEGGLRGRGDISRPASTLFEGLQAGAGLAYLAVAVAALLPRAYTVPGLLAVTILATAMQGLAQPARTELTGAGRARQLVRLQVRAYSLQTLLALAAPVLGPFARSLGAAASGVASWVLFRRARSRLEDTRHDDALAIRDDRVAGRIADPAR